VELEPRDVTPTYFEAHVGLTPDDPGPEIISADPVRVPGTDVQVRGKIDRLDMTADGGIVGMDYKTGSTPSESDTIDGHAFQLPAYLLMAETALDAEPIGASYYQVNPTASVSPHGGTVGGEADAAHARWGTGDPAPLRRHRSLTFDTREEFNAFLHDTVADRISRVAAAVEGGSFHPSVLGADTAGCEYCPYRDACDVRHHRRHAIHGTLTDADTPQYAPGVDTEESP
jgi:ATP-dependent helicase/nuclease subunit B